MYCSLFPSLTSIQLSIGTAKNGRHHEENFHDANRHDYCSYDFVRPTLESSRTTALQFVELLIYDDCCRIDEFVDSMRVCSICDMCISRCSHFGPFIAGSFCLLPRMLILVSCSSSLMMYLQQMFA
jgi:hypothetical protein